MDVGVDLLVDQCDLSGWHNGNLDRSVDEPCDAPQWAVARGVRRGGGLMAGAAPPRRRVSTCRSTIASAYVFFVALHGKVHLCRSLWVATNARVWKEPALFRFTLLVQGGLLFHPLCFRAGQPLL